MICPICKQELIKINGSYKCKNQHSFDTSKSGYVNLLLNNKNSGDNKEMVNARHNFLNKNYYLNLKNRLDEIIKSMNVTNILDVGCGDGYFDKGLNNLIGIDISKEAIIKASKNNKDGLYVVASSVNLPFADNEFDLILNIFAPHNEEEFTRLTSKYIIKVVPGINHLIELKQILYKNVILKEEKHLEFKSFKEINKINVNYKANVDDLYELLMMTPYFYTSSINKELLDKYNGSLITCDFVIMIYEKIEKRC